MKDTTFYSQESVQYSAKRYPPVANSYVQFFFKRRLVLVCNAVSTILLTLPHPSLLEVGCADGIILRELQKHFPDTFTSLVGIDTAMGMIEEAKKINPHNMEFFLRSEYSTKVPTDLLIEIGVLNYANATEEISFAQNHVKVGGYYLLSIAGTESLRNRLKGEEGFNDFRSYREYEDMIKSQFTIVRVRGCGLFIPYLWRLPFIARIVQALLDPIAGVVAPNLCHEKLYLLRKN